LNGPVYLDEDTRHNFNVIVQSAEKVKELSGPVYLKENTVHASLSWEKVLILLKT